jgi:hypothetical protein
MFILAEITGLLKKVRELKIRKKEINTTDSVKQTVQPRGDHSRDTFRLKLSKTMQ